MRKVRPGTFFWALVPALLLLTIPLLADSHVRIVRLSDVEGTVQVDRNIGLGFENAFLNLPITEGVKLRTQSDGRAEIEFENGTTLRIAPLTEIHFDQLSLGESGTRNSSVSLAAGMLYVDCDAAREEDFSIKFGHQTVKLNGPAHFRLGADSNQAALSVFSGQVQIQSPSGEFVVSKNQTGNFDLTKQDQYRLVKKIEPSLFDDWDKSQLKYHDRYLKAAAYKNSSPYSYGLSDLNYYGYYVNVPGHGMVWQPRLAGADWDPFSCGRWAWYPAIGSVWVSCYPWGWMPFYYGAWNYDPAFHWYWDPAGASHSWNYAPVIASAPPKFVFPRPPARPVHGGGGSRNPVVVVNSGLAPLPGTREKIVMRAGSAALGVPRGAIRNWNKVDAQAQRSGEATATFRAAPMPVLPPEAGFQNLSGNIRTMQASPGLSAYRSPVTRSSASAFSGRAAGSRGSAIPVGRSAPSMPSSSQPARSAPAPAPAMPAPATSSPAMSSTRSSGSSAPAPARR